MPQQQKQILGICGSNALYSLRKMEIEFAREENRQARGFLLNSGAFCLGEFAEWLDVHEQPLALKLMRPDARDRAIDQHRGGDPALVAVDTLIVLRGQQVVLLSMSEQIGIEIRKQTN